MRTRSDVEEGLEYNKYGHSSATDSEHRDAQTLLLLDIRELLEKKPNLEVLRIKAQSTAKAMGKHFDDLATEIHSKFPVDGGDSGGKSGIRIQNPCQYCGKKWDESHGHQIMPDGSAKAGDKLIHRHELPDGTLGPYHDKDCNEYLPEEKFLDGGKTGECEHEFGPSGVPDIALQVCKKCHRSELYL